MQNPAFSRLIASRVRLYRAVSGFPGCASIDEHHAISSHASGVRFRTARRIEELLVEIPFFAGPERYCTIRLSTGTDVDYVGLASDSGLGERPKYVANNRSASRKPSSVSPTDFERLTGSRIKPFSCKRFSADQSKLFQARFQSHKFRWSSASTTSSMASRLMSIVPPSKTHITIRPCAATALHPEASRGSGRSESSESRGNLNARSAPVPIAATSHRQSLAPSFARRRGLPACAACSTQSPRSLAASMSRKSRSFRRDGVHALARPCPCRSRAATDEPIRQSLSGSGHQLRGTLVFQVSAQPA